jgi:hypothetical protein
MLTRQVRGTQKERELDPPKNPGADFRGPTCASASHVWMRFITRRKNQFLTSSD